MNKQLLLDLFLIVVCITVPSLAYVPLIVAMPKERPAMVRRIPHEKPLLERTKWLMKYLCTGPLRTDKEVELRQFYEQTLTEVIACLKDANTLKEDGAPSAANHSSE